MAEAVDPPTAPPLLAGCHKGPSYIHPDDDVRLGPAHTPKDEYWIEPDELSPWFHGSRDDPKGGGIILSNTLASMTMSDMKHELLFAMDKEWPARNDKPPTQSKSMRSAATISTIFQLLCSLPHDARFLYTTSHPQHPSKLFFDIEYEYDKEQHHQNWRKCMGPNAALPTCPADVLRVFLPRLRAFLERNDRHHGLDSRRLAVSSAHSDRKVSFHVVCLDYYIAGQERVFIYGNKSPKQDPWGVIALDPDLGPLMPNVVDSSSRTNFRHERTLYSTKIGQQRWLQPVDEFEGNDFFFADTCFETFKAHTWTYVPADCAVQLKIPPGMRRAFDGFLSKTYIETHEHSTAEGRGVEEVTASVPRTVADTLHDCFVKHLRFDMPTPAPFDPRKSQGAFYARQKQRGGGCVWCKKEAHANNFIFFATHETEDGGQAGGELALIPVHTHKSATCAPKALFASKEPLVAAQAAFERSATKLEGPDLRTARKAVRNLKYDPDPRSAWSLAEADPDRMVVVKMSTPHPRNGASQYLIIQFTDTSTRHRITQLPWLEAERSHPERWPQEYGRVYSIGHVGRHVKQRVDHEPLDFESTSEAGGEEDTAMIESEAGVPMRFEAVKQALMKVAVVGMKTHEERVSVMRLVRAALGGDGKEAAMDLAVSCPNVNEAIEGDASLIQEATDDVGDIACIDSDKALTELMGKNAQSASAAAHGYHGLNKHLPLDIVNALVGGDAKTRAKAWAMVTNLAACVEALANDGTGLHAAQRKKANMIAAQLNVDPPPEEAVRAACKMCAAKSGLVLQTVSVCVRIDPVVSSRGGADASHPGRSCQEEHDKLEKMLAANTVYEFISLPPDEKGGASFLRDQLGRIRETGTFIVTDKEIDAIAEGDKGDDERIHLLKLIVEKKKLANRRAESVLRLLGQSAFLMYEEAHRWAAREGCVFPYSFNEDVDAQNMLHDIALFLISHKGLFRVKENVYRKASPSYEFVSTYDTLLSQHLFAVDGFEACERYLASERKRTKQNIDPDGVLLAGDRRWPDRELMRGWYSCPGGLYSRDEDIFYPAGSDQFTKLMAERDVVALKHYPDATWDDALPTPNFDQIFHGQGFDDAETRLLQALTGRALYRLNEYSEENWQLALFLLGAAGSGKSMLLEIMCDFFPDKLFATLQFNKQGGVGSLMHLIGAEFVAMFETASDFHDPNFHKVWNSMIVGEVVTIPRLQNVPAQFRWSAPFAHAGNTPFRWTDDQGATKRRLVIFDFKPIAPDQVDTTLLANVKRTEMVMIIAKCNRAYRALVRKVGKSSFHSYLSASCPRIAAAGERVSYENSTVQQYMEACFIPADAASPAFSRTAVTIAEFNRGYSQWVSFTKPNASAKNVTSSILQAETAQYARVKNRPDINVRIIPRAEGRKQIGQKKSDCFVIGVTLRSYFDADKPDAGDTI